MQDRNIQRMKDQLQYAWELGLVIQSNHSGEWKDFEKQNQLDRPNFDFGEIGNWRIKPDSEHPETPNNKWIAVEEECIAGCKTFTGGEKQHHHHCPFYPGSLTEYNNNLRLNQDQKIKELKEAKDNFAIDFAKWISESPEANKAFSRVDPKMDGSHRDELSRIYRSLLSIYKSSRK